MLGTPILSVCLAAIGYLVTPALAQATTNATCQAGFEWMNNAEYGQSPCLVSAYLQAACGTGTWNVPALPKEPDGTPNMYQPPRPNDCTCSTAVYNTISACASCQDGEWMLFAPWSIACLDAGLLNTTTFFPVARIPIPDLTEIPFWAQKDPRTWSGGRFNVTEAQLLGSQPPSTPLEETGNKSSNVGAIVGGVVGGVLGIALICAILFLVWRKRQQRFNQHPDSSTIPSEKPFSSPNMSGNTSPPALASIVAPIPVRPGHIHGQPSDTTSYSHMEPQRVENAPGLFDSPSAWHGAPYAPTSPSISEHMPGHHGTPVTPPTSRPPLMTRLLSRGSSSYSSVGLLHRSPSSADPSLPVIVDEASTTHRTSGTWSEVTGGLSDGQPNPFPAQSSWSAPQTSEKRQRINPPVYVAPSSQVQETEASESPLSPYPLPITPNPPSYLASQGAQNPEDHSVAPSSAVFPTGGTHDAILSAATRAQSESYPREKER